ncbi:hypothetical protein ACFSVJ_29790 [Prauserella oleivorans]
MLQLVVVYLPLGVGGLYMLLTEIPALAPILVPGAGHVTSARFYLVAFVVSLVTFFGVTLAGLTLVFGLARLLNLLVRPDRVYPLYGLHYSLHRAVTRLTNVRFYLWLVGDSSYVVHYLRALGYDLSRVEQTGSNFGTMVRQDTPYLTMVGTGTMVADGLAVVNADYSGTSFRVSRTTIGPRNFLGNGVVYPAQGRTGDNCLLATKVMVPLDGPVREGVGLLGSPAFEIPGRSSVTPASTISARGGVPQAAVGEEPVQPAHHGRHAGPALAVRVRLDADRAGGGGSLRRAGRGGGERVPGGRCGLHDCLLRPGGTLPHAVPPAAAPPVLDL